ncbi:MAG: sporulation membrane protein YtaF [Defluviitaleaceae bacterium]|nr:sporulation membrane protein YtaF [Defluviitaleaceae bacterium]
MVNINISWGALVLALILSIDIFAVSFAYGTSRIKIPFKSIMIITIVGSVILGLSIYFGAFLLPFMPEGAADVLAFIILFTLGIIKIFDSLIKRYIRKKGRASKKVQFSAFSLKFVLDVYADPEKADLDKSRVLSPKESLAVAIAVALDAFALGFGAGLIEVNPIQIIGFSLIIDVAAVLLGCFVGKKIAQKVPINLSWLGGVILIVLAFV